VTARVYGYIASLHLGALAEPSGGGFIDPGIDVLPTVPEPETYALMVAGLALLTAGRARRGNFRKQRAGQVRAQ